MGVLGGGVTIDGRFDNLVVSSEPMMEANAPPPNFTRTPGRPTATPRPSPTPTPTPGPNDGLWSGRTSTGRGLSFSVVNGLITTLSADYGIQGNSCSVTGSPTLRLSNPQPVTGGAFSVEEGRAATLNVIPLPGQPAYEVEATVTLSVTGRLTSTTASSGTFNYSVFAPQMEPPCQGSERGTWTATRN